jgi:L-fucose mutarotase
MLEFEAIVSRHEPASAVVPLMGEAFYDRVRAAYALVATGEARLYGNLVLRKGVVRPA